MEVSILPGDFRSDLATQVPLSIQKTLEVVESFHVQRETNALRDFDRDSIRNQIIQQMLDKDIKLPTVGWYVADNLKGSRVFLIRSVEQPEIDVIGFIPYKTEKYDLPYWDGMIIDLDNRNFLIHPINYKSKLITELPLSLEGKDVIFHGFDQADWNKRVRINFGGPLNLIPYLESPHLRFWRRDGRVYCSTRTRIDAWNMKATHTKTYAQIWAEMTNGLPLENLFSNVETDDFCFVIQFNVPELLPYTVTNSYSIVKLTTLAINPTSEPIPDVNLPYYPVYNIDQANHWLGFGRQGDPRLNEGNAIKIYDPNTNSFVLLRSHAYAWRSNLIGPYDCTFSWAKRYLEVCNARFLSEEKYNSIFPNVLGRPLSKPLDRLENTSFIWVLISPVYLRQEAQGLFSQYWGNNGEIDKLAKYLAVPENFNRLSVPQRILLAKLAERCSQKLGKNMPKEKLYRKLFLNGDLTKPHIFGNDLYPYIRDMRKQEKYLAHLEKVSKSM